MMTKQQTDAAWKYILAIRNVDKREYAIRYINSLLYPSREPDEPEGLSYMVTQVVRMRLHEIWNPRQ